MVLKRHNSEGLSRGAKKHQIPFFTGQVAGRTLTSVIFGALTLAGCSSGITQTEEVCASSRVRVAVLIVSAKTCGMLSSGSTGQSDLGALYLAAAEFQEAQVAEGRETDAMAMLELADFNAFSLPSRISGAIKNFTTC